jgi:hypothetical protein
MVHLIGIVKGIKTRGCGNDSSRTIFYIVEGIKSQKTKRKTFAAILTPGRVAGVFYSASQRTEENFNQAGVKHQGPLERRCPDSRWYRVF